MSSENTDRIAKQNKKKISVVIGNRSALEWVLDQYKEGTPRDPTIAKHFNTYRFADYKHHVIDLLMRVTTVSVETMRIVNAMPLLEHPDPSIV